MGSIVMDITHITSAGRRCVVLYGMSIMVPVWKSWQAARCRAYCKSTSSTIKA